MQRKSPFGYRDRRGGRHFDTPRALGTVLLFAALLASCGATPASDSPPPNAVTELCDGTDAIRLSAVVSGGGPISPRMAMVGENGWQYILASGKCEAYILSDVEAPLRRLEVSNEQEHALSRAFRLGQWDSRYEQPGGGCADGGGIRFRFDDRRLVGVPCGLSSAHPLRQLSEQFQAQVDALAITAALVDGDIRYVLVADDTSGTNDSSYRNAPLWPLATAPAAVAITVSTANIYERGQSRRASGGDAAQLRDLRAAWRDGTIGNKHGQFIPVLAEDGARYQLYARDACAWENQSGLLPDQ